MYFRFKKLYFKHLHKENHLANLNRILTGHPVKTVLFSLRRHQKPQDSTPVSYALNGSIDGRNGATQEIGNLGTVGDAKAY